MKGIRIYLILLGVVAAISLYFFLGRRDGTYAPSMNEFAVRDTGRIGSVWISAPANEVSLAREGGRWLVNGDPARKESIHALYVLISRLEAGAPVSRSLEKRVQDGLEDRSTRVRIRMEDKREKAYRVWYDSLSSSTFMIMEGSDIPFRVRVRGYGLDNLQELYPGDSRYWRDNLIFHFLPGDIRYIFLMNNADTGRSFHLARNEEGNFEIAGGEVPGSWKPAAEERVSQYLGYFYDVRFESFLDPRRDTLRRSEKPDFILSLELTNHERVGVELFPVYRAGSLSGTDELDFNMLYARLTRGDEWVVVKYVQIDPLLKEFEYFAGL